jgi:hypothetical protein
MTRAGSIPNHRQPFNLVEIDTMKRLSKLHAAWVAAGLFGLSAVHAQDATATEFKASRDRIAAEYRAAKANCDKLDGNAKDVCIAEAKGKRDVAHAEDEFKRTGRPEDKYRVELTRAQAAYKVAKQACDDKKGDEADVCIKQAKAAEARAKADANQILEAAKAPRTGKS